jgi:hypothetical protein
MRAHAILRGTPVPLIVGFGLFVVAIAYVVASSFAKPSVAVFAATPIGARERPAAREDTITIDARDDRRWTFADLHAGAVLAPADTASWDIAVRRHRLIASGTIADLGAVDFASITSAPAAGFVRNTYGSDSTNAAVGHWYVYNMLTHVLDPNGHVYVVRPREGNPLKVQIVSYYCPGIEAGCLTIRFAPLE